MGNYDCERFLSGDAATCSTLYCASKMQSWHNLRWFGEQLLFYCDCKMCLHTFSDFYFKLHCLHSLHNHLCFLVASSVQAWNENCSRARVLSLNCTMHVALYRLLTVMVFLIALIGLATLSFALSITFPMSKGKLWLLHILRILHSSVISWTRAFTLSETAMLSYSQHHKNCLGIVKVFLSSSKFDEGTNQDLILWPWAQWPRAEAGESTSFME